MNKQSSDFTNELSPARAERLAVLLEELGEAQQAIGKILRHGYQSGWPVADGSNRRDLEKELGHVQYAVWMLIESGDLAYSNIHKSKDLKETSIQQFLHHQPEKPK